MMNRRDFVSGLALFGSGILCRSTFGQTLRQPNILVVMVDDMGYSDIGCYGGEIETPNLDQMAADGIRFTQFYNTARCCPSRASLLTGLYPHQAGIGHMVGDSGYDGYRGELNRSCVTIAEVLGLAGYGTYMVGKWHVTRRTSADGPKDTWPRQRGFDHYYGTLNGAGSFYTPATLTRDNEALAPTGEEYYYTDALSSEAVTFVRQHLTKTPERPFFMYLAYTAPHWPLHAPRKTVEKYRGRYGKGWAALRRERYERMRSMGLISDDWALSPDDSDARNWADLDEAKRLEMDLRMAVYAAQVDHVDQGMGRLLAALRASGKLDDTLILFLADNGGCAEGGPLGFERKKGGSIGENTSFASYGLSWANASNTPFRRYKHYVHEGGISSPLIVHWPRRFKSRGGMCHTPGHIVDLMPTCLDAASAAYPQDYKGHAITPHAGVSLLPACAGGEFPSRPMFWEHEGNRAVRMGEWKLVAKGKTGPWELYNLRKDRTELNDLAAVDPGRVGELAALWQAWAERSNVLPLCPSRSKAGPAGSKARHFELAAGADLAQAKCPRVAGRPFRIHALVKEWRGDGVIVAHGGSRVGYSLYIRDKRPVFCLRNRGETTRLTGSELPASGQIGILAQVSSDLTVSVAIDGAPPVTTQTGSLLYDMPTEGLQVGFDSRAAAGEYKGEFRFAGDIERVTIDLLNAVPAADR